MDRMRPPPDWLALLRSSSCSARSDTQLNWSEPQKRILKGSDRDAASDDARDELVEKDALELLLPCKRSLLFHCAHLG
jgi:hypothetical protein